MSKNQPVILIGMDATEITLIDALLAQGRMPTMAKLRERGRYGRLQTQPPQFLSMVWPTFYSSMGLGHHGWYFNKQWRAGRQRLEYIDPKWMPNRSFLEGLDPAHRVAVLDLPFAPFTPKPKKFNGVFLTGWQCHDDFGRQKFPNELWARVAAKHGQPRLTPEVFGEQSVSSLLAQRIEVLETNEQFAGICADFLNQERWDLFLAVFGAVHRGTHYLWDLSQIDTDGTDGTTLATLRGARDDCYTSWDTALGRVVDAAPEDARIVVFALHGMDVSDGWFQYLPRIVEQVHRGGSQSPPPKTGLVYRVKKALPWKVVRQVTRRIPHAWNKALVPIWSQKMYDWSTTKYFTLPMDFNGYIRLNIKGRETEGIVAPGDVESECANLRDALLSFRDIDTQDPVITDVVRVDDVLGSDIPRRSALPDLVVIWANPHGALESNGVVSDQFGEVRWGRGTKFSSGRSGNHTQHGWYVAMGPGIEPGESAQVHDALDLMPTAFEWMGADPPDFFQGKPIGELIGSTAAS